MGKIELVVPTEAHETQAAAYVKEHVENGEIYLHGGASIHQMPYAQWLQQLKNNADPRTVNPEWVVSSTFFAMMDEEIVGMLDIRHTLNQFLREFGGNIGYGVRPSRRGRGYAKEILQLGLAQCKTFGLEKVLLGCNKENVASSKTIEMCGGVLEKEFVYVHGKTVRLYWIELESV